MTDADEEQFGKQFNATIVPFGTVPSTGQLLGSGAIPIHNSSFGPPTHYILSSEPDGTCRTGSTSTGRSGNIGPPLVANTSKECNIHEVCYYFQQVIFILAILTGIALVIAGGVMHMQSGELIVFVYIGILLFSVNLALLLIQCFVRRKQKRRMRTYSSSRQVHVPNSVQYSAVNTTPPPPQQIPIGIITSSDGRHYYNHPIQTSVGTAQSLLSAEMQRSCPTQATKSPTDSQIKYLCSVHSVTSVRQGSVSSHNHPHHSKDKYHYSPPLGQHVPHRAVITPSSSQLPTPRSELAQYDFMNSPSAPPPSYNDLLRCGRLPREGTTVHLI